MNFVKFIAASAILLATSTATHAQNARYSAPENDGQSYWLDSNQEGRDQRALHKYKFFDNWYIGLQGGGLYNWGTNQGEYGFFRHLRPSAALQFGKWMSPSMGMRAQLIYGNNRGVSNTPDYKTFHWQSLSLYADGMLNLTNMWCGYEESRFFNFIVFAGIGGEQTFSFSKRDWNKKQTAFNRDHSTLLGLRAGFITLFRLNDKFDLSFEMSNTWTDDSYDGVLSSHRWDGHVNAFLGINYRFMNPSDGGNHQFTYARLDNSKADALNNELNKLRAELDKANRNIPVEVRNSRQVNVLVSFEDNSTSIDKLQEVNVFTAVQEMRKVNNNADLYITKLGGNSSSDNLFDKRAQTLKNSLVNEYNVPASRIIIEKDPAKVEAANPVSSIILYINENGKLN